MITTTYLQISDPATWRTRHSVSNNMFLQPAASSNQCARLHHLVGSEYYWDRDRADWNASDWENYCRRDDVDVSVIRSSSDHLFGYCELNFHPGGSTEILYFGLCPNYVGRGLGKDALNLVINRCIDLHSTRIWLHTCNLDHPAALANYYRQGFEFWKETETDFMLPEITFMPAVDRSLSADRNSRNRSGAI